ncbi:MAG: hypothetical protein M1365_06285, partial [Actinobacteria bacterium]|nr:hypothetical protein [Actinomycetota bacterium]
VLLPFMSIMIAEAVIIIRQFLKVLFLKYLFLVILFLAGLLQVFETYSWLPIRISSDPRIESSKWMESNIQKKTLIGLENIPIYQMLPDLTVKEFYLGQYDKNYSSNFRYNIVSSTSTDLPDIVIISNDQLELQFANQSDKKKLAKRLINEKYKAAAIFTPDFFLFKKINNEFDFYISGLVFTPNTITVYRKN